LGCEGWFGRLLWGTLEELAGAWGRGKWVCGLGAGAFHGRKRLGPQTLVVWPKKVGNDHQGALQEEKKAANYGAHTASEFLGL